MLNNKLAIDPISTHLRRCFAKSLPCCLHKLLRCGLGRVRFKYDRDIQRAGFDRGYHVAENERSSARLALGSCISNEVVKVGKIC